ncbi:MAG: prolyl oligopeptidase family serine peptidase [Anaerolineaceae bacterium]
MPGPQSQPYGLWNSPLSPFMLSQRLRLDDVQWDSDGKTLVWLEGRSDRGVLVSRPEGEAPRDLTDEQLVRGGIGYGGGDFTIVRGLLIFAERSGRLYARNLGYSLPRPITPAYGMLASPQLSPDGQWIAYVFSDGQTDLIGLVDARGSEWPLQLARGADFYMQPAWHPDSTHLAWIEWDHPNMPWDGTRLRIARLSGSQPRLTEVTTVAGDQDTPVAQPLFSPDGRYLAYIVSDGEWDCLELLDLQSGDKSRLVEGDHFHLALPTWAQGIRTYGWSHTSQRLYYLRNYAGLASLWSVELASGLSTQIDTAPYTWLSQLAVSPASDELAMIASAPAFPDRIVRWDGQRLHVERRSEPENLPPEFFPTPIDLTWPAPDGTLVHGLYYPPANPDYTSGGLPPAIINIHGGPTSQALVSYAAGTAYFTSRGYAWLEVNYRGSSGYGRSYQNALRLKWGLIDRQDAAGGAHALVDQGLADPARLVIKGGSAGGYTVLNSLVYSPGLFRAAIDLYGVSNLYGLAKDTHKFEQHYNDTMIGFLPEAAGRYHDWSPVFHADKIQDPIAIFQGDSDRVVPPDQSEDIVKVLRTRGVPHIFRLYQGEGHGFRKSETIADYLKESEKFLQQHVIFVL